MLVNFSPLAGAGAQFFDNNGVPLAGGLLYTYFAGTTTPLPTYTSSSGSTANENPIILDSAGRVPEEIWLPNGYATKFVLKTSTDVQIWSKDNIPASPQPPIVNDAGSITYDAGDSVTAGSFIIGQTYVITSIGSTNFLNVGAVSNTVGIYFIATGVGSGSGTANFIRTVQTKLRESVSVKDFGAIGNGVADDSAAFNDALTASDAVYVPEGTYLVSVSITLLGKKLIGASKTGTIINYTGSSAALIVGGSDNNAPEISDLTVTGTSSATAGILLSYASNGCRRGKFDNVLVTGFTGVGVYGWDISASINNGIYYNTFITCGSELNSRGWRVYSSDGATNGNRANANTFINCTAISNTGDGWFIDWAVGNTLTGCDREANGGFGINSDHVLDLTVIGGYSETNTLGAVNKTANGNVKLFGGRVIDAVVGTALSGDIFAVGATGLAVSQTGGIGMGATPPVQGINGVNTSSMTFALSGATYLTLDNANAMNFAAKAIRQNGVVKSSTAGALSLAGVTVGYVEITLTENITSITMPSSIDGFEICLVFTNGVGPYTVAGWPATVSLAGGTFTVTATNGKRDTITFRYHSDFSKWLEIARTQNL